MTATGAITCLKAVISLAQRWGFWRKFLSTYGLHFSKAAKSAHLAATLRGLRAHFGHCL